MKAQLKKLVAQEELDQVLEILLDYLETHNANLYNVGVHLSARYRHWKEKTGWAAEEIDKIARFYPEKIKRGKRADETIIYRLNPPWREAVKDLIN